MDVRQCAASVPVTAEQLEDARGMADAFDRFLSASPEQRMEWAKQSAEARRAERDAAEPAPLTLEALLDKLGWSQQYAEHAVQTYCQCEDTRDGWERCSHAIDLGIDR